MPSLASKVISGDQVQVLGAVRTPGLYSLKSAGSVVEALGVAGGAAGNADLSKVKLARRAGGGASVYELDVQGYLYEGYPQADLKLRPGDTVTVPSKGGLAGNALHVVLALAPVLSAVASVLLLARN